MHKSENSKTKSPLKGNHLRYPGQSLDEEIDELVNNRVILDFMMAATLLVAAIFSWWSWVFPSILVCITLTVIAVVFLPVVALRISKQYKRLQRLKLGRDGERRVGQYLEYLRSDGYRVFHDLIDGDANTDHILIGPAGVFTVETKTWSKPVRGDAGITYDGKKLLINGWEPNPDPLKQAKAQAASLKRLLFGITGSNIPVQPVIAFPGRYVETPGRQVDVIVLNPEMLPKFLKKSSIKLQPARVAQIANQLDHEIRRTN